MNKTMSAGYVPLDSSSSGRHVCVRRRQQIALRTASVCLSLLLSGCGIISGSGPYQYSIKTTSDADLDKLPYDLIELGPTTIAGYLRPALTEPVAGIAEIPLTDVTLVPGDALRILMSDNSKEGAVFAPLAMGGTTFDQIRSDSHGNISLPYLGKISVAGKTLSQVEDAIRRNLRSRQEVGGLADVHVELAGDWSGSVLVAGAVNRPGRFSALQGPLTVLDVINLAGGPSLEPHQVNVVIRNGVSVITVPYLSVLEGKNVALPPRSEVVLENATKRFVAMGAVGQPGLHDLPSANPSLLEVLGKAGGLNDRSANPSGVFVFRMVADSETKTSRAQVFRLNMRDPASIFMARQFRVLSEDAVYVTNAPVYEWQKIISPIVQAMFLGNTL